MKRDTESLKDTEKKKISNRVPVFRSFPDKTADEKQMDDGKSGKGKPVEPQDEPIHIISSFLSYDVKSPGPDPAPEAWTPEDCLLETETLLPPCTRKHNQDSQDSFCDIEKSDYPNTVPVVLTSHNSRLPFCLFFFFSFFFLMDIDLSSPYLAIYNLLQQNHLTGISLLYQKAGLCSLLQRF